MENCSRLSAVAHLGRWACDTFMIGRALTTVGDTLPKVCRDQEAIRLAVRDRSAVSGAVQ